MHDTRLVSELLDLKNTFPLVPSELLTNQIISALLLCFVCVILVLSEPEKF